MAPVQQTTTCHSTIPAQTGTIISHVQLLQHATGDAKEEEQTLTGNSRWIEEKEDSVDDVVGGL